MGSSMCRNPGADPSNPGVIPSVLSPKWSVDMQNTVPGLPAATPVVSRGSIIFIASYNSISAYDFGSGAFMWSYMQTAVVTPSIALSDDSGEVYFGTSRGELFFRRTASTLGAGYIVLSGNESVTFSPIKASAGKLAVCTTAKLHLVDALLRKTVYTVPLNATISSVPSYSPKSGALYVVTELGDIHAIHEPSGIILFTLALSGKYTGSVALDADGNMYVHSTDGFLTSLNPAGVQRWTTNLRGVMTRNFSPLVDNIRGVVFGFAGSRTCIVLNKATGSFVRSAQLPSFPVSLSPSSSSPACLGADGTLYMSSNSSRLYALSPSGNLTFTALGSEADALLTPAIGADGSVIVASRLGKLYSLTCQECPLGTYGAFCTPCPPGSYSNTTTAAACSLCPQNTSSSAAGATSLSACMACPQGHAADQGSAKCLPTIATHLKSQPSLSSFEALISSVGIWEFLDTFVEFTVMVPTNGALEGVELAAVSSANNNNNKISLQFQFLKNHIFKGYIDVNRDALPDLISSSSQDVFMLHEGAENGTVMIEWANILSSTAVPVYRGHVYVIDKPLILMFLAASEDCAAQQQQQPQDITPSTASPAPLEGSAFTLGVFRDGRSLLVCTPNAPNVTKSVVLEASSISESSTCLSDSVVSMFEESKGNLVLCADRIVTDGTLVLGCGRHECNGEAKVFAESDGTVVICGPRSITGGWRTLSTSIFLEKGC